MKLKKFLRVLSDGLVRYDQRTTVSRSRVRSTVGTVSISDRLLNLVKTVSFIFRNHLLDKQRFNRLSLIKYE